MWQSDVHLSPQNHAISYPSLCPQETEHYPSFEGLVLEKEGNTVSNSQLFQVLLQQWKNTLAKVPH